MNDQHPPSLNIEIDRDRLRNYLRARWLLAYGPTLSIFGVLIGFASVGKASDHGFASRAEAVLFILRCGATGIVIALIVTALCYLFFGHRLASRLAASLEVSVEGAFLHVRQHAATFSDRKLHFRSIVDYAATQDALMRRFGIHALQMSTTAGGQNATLIIPGVRDCLRVRDDLADIDRQRENL